MRRTGGRVVGCFLLAILAAGCGDSDAAAVQATSSKAAVSRALTDGVTFENGVVRLLPLPDPTGDGVGVPTEGIEMLLAPDAMRLMSLEVDDSQHDSDPVTATLLQFEDATSHVEVPVQSDGGKVDVDMMVHSTVCDTLCPGIYEISVYQVVVTGGGTVSEHVPHTAELDCTDSGDPTACEGDAKLDSDAGSVGS